MSGLELVGFVVGILGPIEQSITLFNLLRDHFKSNKTITSTIAQLLPSLTQLQHQLVQLENQLKQYQQSIPHNNYQTFQFHLSEIQKLVSTICQSLIKMEKSAKRKIYRLINATKWASECQAFQSQINDAQLKVLQISSFLGQKADIASTVGEAQQHIRQDITQAKQQIVKTIESNGASSSTGDIHEQFIPYYQKLPVSIGAISNFESLASDGNPLTTEGKLKKQLLCKSETLHTKLFAVQGLGGVGKTTCLHMLSHNQELKEHFVDGIYYIKLGADAKTESAISAVVNIVRKSGGTNRAREIYSTKSINEAIDIASEWFYNKKFLLLVDDIWERKQFGSLFLSLLKRMLSESSGGSMVFTTRDPDIASEAAETFLLNCRDPHGPESRAILFQHARLNSEYKYEEETEECIKALLETCGGLPVAHSVVGKGVSQYSMRRNVGYEKAWRMYAKTQKHVLQGRADGYDCLYAVFKAAICVLEEEEMRTNNEHNGGDKYCYGEIHRSLCVLERQQWAPIQILTCLWNMKSEVELREICTNLVRVGLAEWHTETISSDQQMDTDLEGISIHDLIHEFATAEAMKENETEIWHRRVVEGYGHRMKMSKDRENGCREWWKSEEWNSEADGGYLMKNLCRHLHEGRIDGNEVVILVTRPEWIRTQLSKNGLSQYEKDVQYGCEWIEKRGEGGIDRDILIRDLGMIREAVRLSSSYIYKNGSEVWFQLYGRLMRLRNESEGLKRYVEYLEREAPRPWLRPTNGVLAHVGSGGRSLVDVRQKILCMVVVPGYSEVVCGCDNGEMVVVDVKESFEKNRWEACEYPIMDMAISPNGRFLVALSKTIYAKIWEMGSWSRLGTIKWFGMTVVRISSDERYVLTGGSDGIIRFWDVNTRNCVGIVETGSEWIHQIDVLRSGEGLVTVTTRNGHCNLSIRKGRGGAVSSERITEEALDEPVETFQETKIEIHNWVTCVKMNHDDSRMVTGHDDGSVQVWDVNTARPLINLWTGHHKDVRCVSFNNDGTMLVSGSSDRTIQVRDIRTGQLVCNPFVGNNGDIREVYFNEEDNVISCSEDGTVRLWNICQSFPEEAEGTEDVSCIACSPDGSCFVSGDYDGGLCIWDAVTRRVLRKASNTHQGRVTDVAVTPDCRWILSVGFDNMVRVSNWDNLKLINSLKGHFDCVLAVKIGRCGELAVSTSWDKTIRIWDLKKLDGSHEIITQAHRPIRIFLSEDHRRIISTSKNIDGGFVEVWNIESKQRLLVKRFDELVGNFSKEDIMCEAKEPHDTGNKIFSPLRASEIRYGYRSHSIVLGSLETSFNRCAYSECSRTAAIIINSKLRFVKLEF